MFDQGIGDPAMAVFLMQCIQGLSDPNAQAYVDALFQQQAVLPGWVSSYRRTDGQLPNLYFGSNNSTGAVVISGTENSAMGISLLSGYTSLAGFGSANDINSYLVTIAQALASMPNWNRCITSTQLVLTGHSLGGAAVTPLPLLAQAAGQQGPRLLVTFGAPKSGTSRLNDEISGTNIARWMNSDDAVPLVPPTVGQAPLLAAVTPIPALLAYAAMKHVRGGRQLDPLGNYTPQELPTDAAIAPTTNLVQWLVSLNTGAPNPHNPSEYIRRLNLYAAAHPTVAQRQRRGADAEPAQPVTAKEINAEISPAVRSIITRGQEQNQGPLIVPKNKIFNTQKISGIWYVTFGSSIVTIGPTRRKAQRLANVGNLFAKRMLRQSQVDSTTMAAQWAEYMSAAADPGSGIRPTLQSGPL